MNKNIEMVYSPTFSMSSSGQSPITAAQLTLAVLTTHAEVFFDGRIPFRIRRPSS